MLTNLLTAFGMNVLVARFCNAIKIHFNSKTLIIGYDIISTCAATQVQSTFLPFKKRQNLSEKSELITKVCKKTHLAY